MAEAETGAVEYSPICGMRAAVIAVLSGAGGGGGGMFVRPPVSTTVSPLLPSLSATLSVQAESRTVRAAPTTANLAKPPSWLLPYQRGKILGAHFARQRAALR